MVQFNPYRMILASAACTRSGIAPPANGKNWCRLTPNSLTWRPLR